VSPAHDRLMTAGTARDRDSQSTVLQERHGTKAANRLSCRNGTGPRQPTVLPVAGGDTLLRTSPELHSAVPMVCQTRRVTAVLHGVGGAKSPSAD
jgi:hypothetical protein